MARLSVSTAATWLAPSRRAAKARMPLPQPKSATRRPSRGACPPRPPRCSARSSRASRQRRVEGWLPVPKALPGSIRISRRWASSAGASSQAGKIKSDWPTGSACQCCFQERLQSSSSWRCHSNGGRERPKGAPRGARAWASSARSGAGQSLSGSHASSRRCWGPSGRWLRATRVMPSVGSFQSKDSSNSGAQTISRRHQAVAPVAWAPAKPGGPAEGGRPGSRDGPIKGSPDGPPECPQWREWNSGVRQGWGHRCSTP